MGDQQGPIPLPLPKPGSRIDEFLDRVGSDDKYKGLVLDINSPGGSPFRSKELGERIENMDLYSVAYIGETGTSGAYWIACSCDQIVASELSMVGSVGTLSIRPDLSKFLEKMGIDIDITSSGKFKGIGHPFSEPTEDENERRKVVMDKIDRLFKEHVKESRGLTGDEEVFEGKVYLGDESKEMGLIDHLGNREKAIEICRKGIGYEDLIVKDFKKEMRKGPSLLDLIR